MKRILSFFFIILCLVSSGHGSVLSSEKPTFYFYNPETNINNFAALKRAFDTYFVDYGGILLQPFDLRETFESVIKKENKGNIFLLSSWHLKSLQQQDIPLQIVMVGTSKGNIMQKKVLSAKKDITDISMLKDTVVAAAGSEAYVHNLLKRILGKENEALLKDIKILIVPKDIDAVMSVGFGMSSAAISAESGLEKLAMFNPNQYRELHSIGASEKDYLLVAATINEPNEQEKQMLEVLRRMSETEEGLANLKMLGIDGWRELE